MKKGTHAGSREPAETDNFLNKKREIHKELSLTVRRSMFALIAYTASCAIIIFQPDVPFVLTSSGVRIPIINTYVNLKAFLIVGPLGLLAITVYLHLFLAKLEEITGLDEYDKQPFLVNFQDKLSWFMKFLIFYAFPPILMLGFSWKSAVDPFWRPFMYLVTMMVSAGMFIVYLKPKLSHLRSIVIGIVTLGVMLFLSFFLGNLVSRGLNLEHAQLAETKIRGVNLERAHLRFADLRGANLRFDDLREADLREANLQGADLRATDLREASMPAADLHRANLFRANLRGADLRMADLRGAKLRKASLDKADLGGADLRTASLQMADLTAANLQGADLRAANFEWADLIGANLQWADLRDANLQTADLRDADLQWADLRDADLRGTKNLTGARLCAASIMAGAKLDQELEKQIRKECPRLLKNP